jgi:hypothetical protein
VERVPVPLFGRRGYLGCGIPRSKEICRQHGCRKERPAKKSAARYGHRTLLLAFRTTIVSGKWQRKSVPDGRDEALRSQAYAVPRSMRAERKRLVLAGWLHAVRVDFTVEVTENPKTLQALQRITFGLTVTQENPI